ncbi:DNA cytosine methyltransferase [Streptomyces sp. A1277]|uniref:DNA cytosine methyltransferase n=1 Tax=Streptomyces sp. A1277 TaxID=2563103 RepID=UPI001F0DD914|nr:DNA cytosine methyltransferase [Streptomyces sp. A1277]
MTAALARARALLDTPPPETIPGQLAAPYGPRIGSLCTGYGGLDMAVQAVFGGTTAWVSDIDPGASRILAHHQPDVPNLGDLTAIDLDAVEPVDILTAGYPCQPFSNAGKRKGTADERHIWPWIARALGVLRPRVAIFENVAGHVRLGFDTVLADLAALGFDAEWCTVRASEIGAAHQRNRLFLLAWPADTGSKGLAWRWAEGAAADGRQPVADAHRVGGDRAGARGGRGDESAARRIAASHAAGLGEREPADEANAVAGSREARAVAGGRGVLAAADTDGDALRHQSVAEPRRRGAAVAQLAGTDSAVDERCCPTCGCGESFHDAGGFCAGCLHCTDPELGRPICPADCPDCAGESAVDAACVGLGEGRPEPARLEGRPDAPISSPPDWGQYAPAIARWEHVIGRPAPSATNALGRLNPPFVEWLMGLPAGHVTDVPGLSRTAQLKALGNGVVPQQAEAALRLLAARAGITAPHPA